MLERTILQRTNATTNSFYLINVGCHSENGCYNERFFNAFIMENSIVAFTRERLHAFHLRQIVYTFY